MDLDIEMDVDVDEGQYNTPIPEAYTHDIITGEEQEPGEVDEDVERTENDKNTAIVPYKIHLRGLDSFKPDDVKAYVAQHSAAQYDRIEWVDDSSANLVFKTESLATEALVALSALAIVDPSSLPPLEAVPAKEYAAKPDSVLQVRFAVEGDKKAAGAAQRSRFYLLHPEYDPEERQRRGDFGRSKYRDRDDSYRGNRRGGRDGRRRDRREEEPRELTFDASLYDDDTSALAQRSTGRRDQPPRRQSTSSDSVHSDRYRPSSRQNREKELFPGRLNASSHRDRARSASPVRDRDGDAHMGEDDNARAAAAMRNREKGRSIKERLIKETGKRENTTPRELFPEKAQGTKDLFPSKVSSGLGGKAQMDRVDDNTILASAKLADRITTRPTSIPPSGGDSLNIRGLASRVGAGGSGSGSGGADRPGLSIKGKGTTVKELFPDKFGNNATKELFAEKLEGRGRRRQRAEDMFF
ncbi:hypothetical protein QBC39DRAFT_274148 [Podospora conica]|nr:hypothetical protein QBC39DRAFT_274148 [Schizothecium conicum]